MKTDLFDFVYPRSQIATRPVRTRDRSRLLVLDRKTGKIRHRRFDDVTQILKAGDCIVVNNTRVLPVRFEGKKARTGGRVSLLLSKQKTPFVWEALIRPGRVRPGTVVEFGSRTHSAEVLAPSNGDADCRVRLSKALRRNLFQKGSIPLPPYMKRAPRAQDADWYQTVYADQPGSIAAPTAGLHFTDRLIKRLRARGVGFVPLTCHIGYATFQSVRVSRIEEHRMHEESYSMSRESQATIRKTKQRGGRVIAVGTSSMRILETLGKTLLKGPIKKRTGTTQLFIRPPFHFQVADALITNFHMPRTSLIMLVSAFAGRGRLMASYQKAIRSGYRLFSYGDAMLIL